MGYTEPERCYIKPRPHFIHFTAGPTAAEQVAPGWAAHEQPLLQGREGDLKSLKRGKGKTKLSLVYTKGQMKARQGSRCLEQTSTAQEGTTI